MNSRAQKTVGVQQLEVTGDRAGQRLDNFLSTQLKGLPKAAVYRLIRTGQVRVNGGRAKPEHKLQAGDTVRVPPARVNEPGDFRVSAAVIEQLQGAILHRDANFLVLDKPVGMAVHSGSGLPWGVIEALRQAWPGQYIELAHRIDRETSGCLVMALNGQALRHLSSQFREGMVKKRYLCLMDGRLPEDRVTVDVPAGKDAQLSHDEQDDDGHPVGQGGKSALTVFRRLQDLPGDRPGHNPGYSYVEAEIFTGRTHQIRQHAKYLGLPLAGDPKYASKADLKWWKSLGLKRMFLHAHQVEFTDLAGEPVIVHSNLPDALRSVLVALETRSD
jgi:23S rRNA pseudouridine955/2504/2580 synthase